MSQLPTQPQPGQLAPPAGSGYPPAQSPQPQAVPQAQQPPQQYAPPVAQPQQYAPPVAPPQAAPPQAAAPAQGGGDYAGFGAASIGNTGDFVKEGQYIFRVDNIELGMTRTGYKKFVVNMTTMHVLEAGPRGHKVGSEAVYMATSKNMDMYYKNVKSACVGIIGGNSGTEFGENELFALAVQEKSGNTSTASGTLIHVNGVGITLNGGGDFTRVDWKEIVTQAELDGIIAGDVFTQAAPVAAPQQAYNPEVQQQPAPVTYTSAQDAINHSYVDPSSQPQTHYDGA